MDISEIWQDYGMDSVTQKLDGLFPGQRISLWELFEKVFAGDVAGAVSDAAGAVFSGLFGEADSLRQTFLWLMALGIAAALISHFIEIFNNHQIADIGFYFTYLLMSAVLMRCFLGAAQRAEGTIAGIVEFVRVFVPAYFLSIGVAAGTVTAAAGYHVVLLLIYLVEHVLLEVVLPMIYSYVLLAVINGLWAEQKLKLLVDNLEKLIRLFLKLLLGLVTGVSVFQSMITPAIDSVKTTALQKSISAIPGVGDVADGVVEVILGSAVVIKNGIGTVMLIAMVIAFAAPLLEILLAALLLKAAAAFLGIVSDRRVIQCTDKVGNGGNLLFQTAGTSMLLFMITVSVAAYTTNRGY